MITMTCCNNSEQISMKTYQTKVVSINPKKKYYRHSNKHLQNK